VVNQFCWSGLAFLRNFSKGKMFANLKLLKGLLSLKNGKGICSIKSQMFYKSMFYKLSWMPARQFVFKWKNACLEGLKQHTLKWNLFIKLVLRGGTIMSLLQQTDTELARLKECTHLLTHKLSWHTSWRNLIFWVMQK